MAQPIPVVPYDDAAFILGNLGVSGGIARTLTLSEVSSALPPPSIPIATTAEAETGTNNTNAITPLRLREALRASGTAPIFACRAWGNFNGTSTPSIRASGNVATFTRNSSGDYTVTFITPMPDTNYAVMVVGVGSASAVSGRVLRGYAGPEYAPSTTSIRFGLEVPGSGTLADAEWIYFAVLR
jgi:hypothetical protein